MHPQVDRRRSTTGTRNASHSGHRSLDNNNIEQNYLSPPTVRLVSRRKSRSTCLHAPQAKSSYVPHHSSRKSSRSTLLDPTPHGKGAVYNGDHPGTSTGMRQLHESFHPMSNPQQFPNSSVSSFSSHQDIRDPRQKGFRHFLRGLFRPT